MLRRLAGSPRLDRRKTPKTRRPELGGELHGRLRQERQILAGLTHPNIARLVDGGANRDGRPYLVMELIDGVAIDQYCAGRDLNLRERLRLFVTVCDAVSYAHRNLVIHRDIKPSNILVTDGGEPKLLDFGIAKLVDGSGGEVSAPAALVTQPGQRLLTPASPVLSRCGASA